MDWYSFTGEVLHQDADRVVTARRLRADEPYFRDHFPGRPVLPGVLGVEAGVSAGRLLLAAAGHDADRLVLAGVRALRFSQFVQPGQWLVCDVRPARAGPADAGHALRLTAHAAPDKPAGIDRLDSLPTALSGRLVLREPRPAPPAVATVEPGRVQTRGTEVV